MSKEKINKHLQFIYGDEIGTATTERLIDLLADFQAKHPQLKKPSANGRFSEKDTILITYGDMVQDRLYKPLQTLGAFLKQHLMGKISTVHLLPFFAHSTSRFSITDYTAVHSDLGDWQAITTIGQKFKLMFDAIINHVSAESDWFERFLQDDPKYKDYFILVDPQTDLSQVIRPRTRPLLTPVQLEEDAEPQYVWTTFSGDQIDLNYANPDVLLDVISVLLHYVGQGAQFIRLDVIAYLWKEIGTTCINLPQTHEIIKLIRTVFNEVAPQVILVSETNVPHEENISYFGDGLDEAQMAYNFTLPPLTLHAFHNGDATTLSQWAATLATPSDEVTFLNFLASHNGIGLLPVYQILPANDILNMADRIKALGGYVSYKSKHDGQHILFELNINYLDALGDPAQSNEDVELIAQRFLASQSIMLALRGIPGIYFHSLFGSQNWHEGVKETGQYRTINRQKLHRQEMDWELANPRSLRHHVFYDYMTLIRHRTSHAAFHPNGAQEVLFLHDAVFSLLRSDVNGRSHILCLTNVSNQTATVEIDMSQLPAATTLTDLINYDEHTIEGQILTLTLKPYQISWLTLS